MRALHVLGSFGLVLAVPLALAAQDLSGFEKRTTVKVLDNGLTAIVCERHEAPVVSFFTHVDVGADREVPGITGLAHMFEHMAFKGTDEIGTKDAVAEKAALEKVEAAYASYDTERRRPGRKDAQKIAALEKGWKDAIAAADLYVVTNAFGEVVEREGGTDLNAFTTSDETGYIYSFPVNRLELWAYLESERFLHPVLREFYKERDVVTEERRLGVESQPIGRLVEQFTAAAFTAHPYGQPVVGWPSDLASFSATDAQEFFARYYVPANMVVAVVGDVTPAQVLPLIEKYFGPLARRPKPEPLRTIEPEQLSEREVVLRDPSQPFYVEGYHRPATGDPDDAAYDAISDILSSGRTSRLYRKLVRDTKVAAQAAGFNGFPGDKYPNLFVLFAVTTPGHTPEEARDLMRAELERLKNEDVSDEELAMVKVRAKANLIRRLGDNSGLAGQLASSQARYGDWRELFHRVDRIDKVTKADIRRVAQATFVAANRTVGVIESTQLAAPAAK
jgi:predicted Zn-dependent peptidase